MMERLGSHRLAVSTAGDGDDSLVETVAAATDDGEVSVLLWSLTLDQTKASGSPALSREVAVEVRGLAAGSSYTLRHDRVDQDHSKVASAWGSLRKADHLARLEPDRVVTADSSGLVRVEMVLPILRSAR